MCTVRALIKLIIPFITLLVAGCGGGGSSGAASNLSGSLALSATPSINSGELGTATANYTSSVGKNPIGLVISFTTDRPDILAISNTSQSVGTNGAASITFRAVSVPTDTTVNIIAKTGGLIQSALVTVKGAGGGGGGGVIPPPVTNTPQSLTFVSADPTQINLKGFGTSANPETSLVTFVVKDTAGSPLGGVTVDFSLNTTTGGITITPASSVSNSSGQVTTIVTSGTMATPVRVTASVRGSSPAIMAQSTQLVIAGGAADQAHFSISLSNFNPEAFNTDGTTVGITARLADHYGNPVADGTAVYFTTNGGSIQSACTTSGGACSVTWTSQNPRTATPGINPGTVAILAYAVGEESFTDVDNNDYADSGACSPTLLPGVGQAQVCGEFTDTPDAFRDDNFNGVHDANEPFYNLAGNTFYSGTDGKYEGTFLPPTSTNDRTKYIFSTSKLIMSSSQAIIAVNPDPVIGPGAINVNVTDVNGNTMPSGTTVAISVPFGTATGATSYTVPNTTGTGVDLPVFISASATPKLQSGIITITVTSPGGLKTIAFIPISGMF